MADYRPEPISLTQVSAGSYKGSNRPRPFVVVGDIPGTSPEIDPQPAPTVNASPADADEVAGDLQDLVTALIAAGVLTGP